MSADAGSLRRKLILMVMATTLVALLVALGAIVAYELRTYHATWTADVTTQAELLGQTTAPALAFDDPVTASENLALLRLRPQIRAAALYTESGSLFASYRREGDQLSFPPLPEAEGMRIEGSNLVLSRRILAGNEIVGTVYLRTDYALRGRLLGYLGIGLLVLATAMAVAFLMSARLQRSVTRPIGAIAEVARQVVQHGDYSRRAPRYADDEVGTLADAFNAMLSEIEQRTGELEEAKATLEAQVRERERAEREVLRLNAELEDRVRERTAQLQAVNQELEAFSYSVSHDLRAPLRAIAGFSQALVEDFPDDAPEEARRYLSRIRAATERMGQLIDDLLNLSRVSRIELLRVPVDVSEIASRVVEELRQQEPRPELAVSVWPGMSAHADPRLLRTAYENLVGNAWKFTTHATRPTIEIGAVRDGGHSVFFVRDNGAGFDMAFAGKLFQAFQRLHGASEYSGTGIGLATVQRIVRRHGGRVWAEGEVGRGATFHFTLGTEATEEP